MRPMCSRGAVVFAVIVMVAAAPATAGEPLTLAAAIREALENNPQQTIQRLEVDKAEDSVAAARGARLPQADLLASASRYGAPTFVTNQFRDPGVFPPIDDRIYDYGMALHFPLYAGGRLLQGQKLAERLHALAAEREQMSRQDLIFNVATVYTKILHLDALDHAYSTRIASLEAQEKRVTLLVDVGRAPRLDRLKINVTLAKARHDQLQVRNRRAEALTLLANLMGKDVPEDRSDLVVYQAAPAPDWSLQELKQSAAEHSPVLKAAEQEVQAAAARRGIARAERLPQLSVIGAYHERQGADTDTFDDWSVGLQFSVPIFDGGVRRHRVGEAAKALTQSEERLVQTRRDLAKQLQDAWNARAETELRLAATASSVTEAGEALAIEKLKYEQGVGTIVDLIQAESALLTAQADRLQAEFDLITARFNLLRVTGGLSAESAGKLVTVRNPESKEQP